MNSKLKSRIKKYSIVAASMILITGASQMAQADVIPYSSVGTYVAFEDLQFPNSDYNYNDESFVFTNITTRNSVPEPAAMLLLGTGLAGLAGVIRKKRD